MRHGERAAYHKGCRCDECKSWRKMKSRAVRAGVKTQVGIGPHYPKWVIVHRSRFGHFPVEAKVRPSELPDGLKGKKRDGKRVDTACVVCYPAWNMDKKSPHPPRKDAPKLFEIALRETKPKCDGDDRFTEYDSEDPLQANAPRGIEAIKMCAGCPLIDLCAEAAIVSRPFHGVYAGRSWENGRLVK